MNRNPWVAGVCLGTAIAVLPVVAAGQSHPDFSGKWVFDAEQTYQRWSVVDRNRQAAGLARVPQAQNGPPFELKHNGNAVIRILQTRNGPVETTWTLDGAERPTDQGVTERARWRGGSIEITTTGSPAPLGRGGGTSPRTRVTTYSLEGPFLVVAEDVIVSDLKNSAPSRERQLSYYKRDR